MRPSIAKIVWNDWVALFAAFAVPIAASLHFAFPYLRRGASSPPALAPVLTALALAVLAWRIGRVRKLFASGRAVRGVVTGVSIVRDRGRLEYAFPLEGTTVRAWFPVHRTKQVLALQVGQEVEVLYDPREPGRAIVKELFAP